MTHEQKGTAMEAVLQPIFGRGFEGIGEVLSSALNFAMLVERENELGAQPYELSPDRAGPANPFKLQNKINRTVPFAQQIFAHPLRQDIERQSTK